MACAKKSLQAAVKLKYKSVQQVADESGVSFQAIYKSFRHDASPRLDTIEKVAACFGMSASEFIALGE